MTFLLSKFVGARFYLAPAVIALYYLQEFFLTGSIRTAVLVLLSLVFILAILANRMWAIDYGERISSGLKRVRDESIQLEESVGLEQARWSNAKMLAVVGLILALITQLPTIQKIPEVHQLPALVLVMLILIALFDAALDLEAEWTISTLTPKRGKESKESPMPSTEAAGAATNAVGAVLEQLKIAETQPQTLKTKVVDTAAWSGADEAKLTHLIWHTNQFRQPQKNLLGKAESNQDPDRIQHNAFSATAQNLIAFGLLITIGVSLAILHLLYLRLFPQVPFNGEHDLVGQIVVDECGLHEGELALSVAIDLAEGTFVQKKTRRVYASRLVRGALFAEGHFPQEECEGVSVHEVWYLFEGSRGLTGTLTYTSNVPPGCETPCRTVWGISEGRDD